MHSVLQKHIYVHINIEVEEIENLNFKWYLIPH